MTSEKNADQVTFCVCTYNSALTLERCLSSIRSISDSTILMVDHHSTDDTLQIARKFTDQVIMEDVSLGYARQACLDYVKSGFIVFVDGDAEIIRKTFLKEALQILSSQKYGAVVGMTSTQKLRLGLPASLLVLRKSDFEGKVIPPDIDARETFFIMRRLKEKHLRAFYIPDAIVHRSQYWRFKPEWIGAWTRRLPSSRIYQIAYAGFTIALISLNTGKIRNVAGSGLTYLRFLRGFMNSGKWLKMERIPGKERESFIGGKQV